MDCEPVYLESILWPQRNDSSDCLSKTQVSAKSNRRCIETDACPMLEGQGDGLSSEKLKTEAPVNGGRNYDGPKVAKFLVG